MNVTITRRSKVGFGYNTSITDDPDGWHIEPPTVPEHVGTIRQVAEALEEDRTLKSLQSTFKVCAWFVRHKGTWLRVKDGQFWHPRDLLMTIPKSWNSSGYIEDKITLEVEKI